MDGCTGVGARDFCASKNTIIETNPNAPSIKADKGQQSPFLRCFIHTYIHHIIKSSDADFFERIELLARGKD